MMRKMVLASPKSRHSACHKVNVWLRVHRTSFQPGYVNLRLLSSAKSKTPTDGNAIVRKRNGGDKQANRDLLVSVLESAATRRDAKEYMHKFNPLPEQSFKLPFHPSRVIAESPRFSQDSRPGPISAESGPQGIALVKIRAPQTLNDATLSGIGHTLSQLAKLGLVSTVVVDCEDSADSDANWMQLAQTQANRIVAAIDSHGEVGAQTIDKLINVSKSDPKGLHGTDFVCGRLSITNRKVFTNPLRRGIIPVVPAIGYCEEEQHAIPLEANEVVLALTREFAGFYNPQSPDEDPKITSERLKALRNEVSLHRLIILDPLGGIPRAGGNSGFHVFLNLQQEFDGVKESLTTQQTITPVQDADIKSNHISDIARGNPFSQFVELDLGIGSQSQDTSSPKQHSTPKDGSEIGHSNPFSQFVEEDFGLGRLSQDASLPKEPTSLVHGNLFHLKNLELIRSVLSLLPPTSSAIITTPQEAAASGRDSDSPSYATRVRTRKSQNPLIHNLLTDKPVYSSSLPVGRRGPKSAHGAPSVSIGQNPTTLVKRGMPITIFPNPFTHPWTPPKLGAPNLALTDPQIDLPRLVNLIDDSFDRKLDIKDYLKRVNDRIAGVIIAGEYDGAALLTWETPPGVVDDGSEASRARMVPYLDKFAVLKRSQGTGGVADILFTAMVRDCFPDGVCWRSRKDNPVNKWYFERSRGTWKMPGTNWTMFWTTPELDSNRQMFTDYENVCRTIQPSWADKKSVID